MALLVSDYLQSFIHCCKSSSQACLAVSDSAVFLHSWCSDLHVCVHSSASTVVDESMRVSAMAISFCIFMMVPVSGGRAQLSSTKVGQKSRGLGRLIAWEWLILGRDPV